MKESLLSPIRLQVLLWIDALSRRLGRKDSFLKDRGLPQSHFYPDPGLGQALLQVSEDYLLYSGWRNSRSQRRSVDREGSAVPWLTYSSIAFLEKLNLADKTVLEFGGGGSTAYFSRRSKSVNTIELNGLYLDALRELGLRNVDFYESPSSPPRFPKIYFLPSLVLLNRMLSKRKKRISRGSLKVPSD